MISTGTPKAKAFSWGGPDTERRKRGEQKGLTLREGRFATNLKVSIVKIPSGILLSTLSSRRSDFVGDHAGETARVTFKFVAKRENLFPSLWRETERNARVCVKH